MQLPNVNEFPLSDEFAQAQSKLNAVLSVMKTMVFPKRVQFTKIKPKTLLYIAGVQQAGSGLSFLILLIGQHQYNLGTTAGSLAETNAIDLGQWDPFTAFDVNVVKGKVVGLTNNASRLGKGIPDGSANECKSPIRLIVKSNTSEENDAKGGQLTRNSR